MKNIAKLSEKEQIILKLLIDIGKEIHGYKIFIELKTRPERPRMQVGTIYTTLSRMDKKGYVRSRFRSEKRFYKLTDLGQRVLEATDIFNNHIER